MATLAVMISLSLTITGCSNGRKSRNFIYNSSSDYSCMGYEIIQDAETLGYYLKNASTGKTHDLVSSPMFGVFSDEEKVQCYYLCPPCIYYTTLVTESYVNRVGKYNSSVTTVSVVELNLDTFEEKVVFEQITNAGRSLFGIDYETGNKWEFLQYHYAFFLNDDSIFFVGNGCITQVNRTTKDITRLNIPTDGSISFDGKSIFYKNEQSVLARYNISTNDTMLYEDIIIYDFCIDEQKIYYISRTDGGTVYSCDMDGNHKMVISNIPAISVTCDTDSVYILEKQNGKKFSFPKSELNVEDR